jgi:multiple sugar transport system substrate-binding protein
MTATTDFWHPTGYLDWLALAPEGKVPARTGTTRQPTRFSDAWAHLETGVEHTKPLSELYPPGVLKVLATSTDTMNRWGFPRARAGWSAPSLPACPSPRPWPPP